MANGGLRRQIGRIGGGALLALALAATPVRAATLYEQLGGRDGIAAISDALIDRVADDPVLGRSFRDTKRRRIKDKLTLQLCELAGGPCRYDGDSMREVHAGHHITQAEFYGLVTVLRQVLRERHVPLAARNQLLRLLAPMKRDVVEAPGAAPPPHPEQARAAEP